MNLIVRRILVIVTLLIISIILLGFSPYSKTEETPHQEFLHVNKKVEQKVDNDSLPLKEERTNNLVAKASPNTQEKNTTVYEITHYTSKCKGCTGITASGYDVKNTIFYGEYRIVAAPKYVPLHTKLNITYEDGTSFDAIVLDRGGAIKSGKLDLLVKDKKEAYQLGRQKVNVKFID